MGVGNRAWGFPSMAGVGIVGGKDRLWRPSPSRGNSRHAKGHSGSEPHFTALDPILLTACQ